MPSWTPLPGWETLPEPRESVVPDDSSDDEELPRRVSISASQSQASGSGTASGTGGQSQTQSSRSKGKQRARDDEDDVDMETGDSRKRVYRVDSDADSDDDIRKRPKVARKSTTFTRPPAKKPNSKLRAIPVSSQPSTKAPSFASRLAQPVPKPFPASQPPPRLNPPASGLGSGSLSQSQSQSQVPRPASASISTPLQASTSASPSSSQSLAQEKTKSTSKLRPREIARKSTGGNQPHKYPNGVRPPCPPSPDEQEQLPDRGPQPVRTQWTARKSTGGTRPVKRTREEKARQRFASSSSESESVNANSASGREKGKGKEMEADLIPHGGGKPSKLAPIHGPNTEQQQKIIEAVGLANGKSFDEFRKSISTQNSASSSTTKLTSPTVKKEKPRSSVAANGKQEGKDAAHAISLLSDDEEVAPPPPTQKPKSANKTQKTDLPQISKSQFTEVISVSDSEDEVMELAIQESLFDYAATQQAVEASASMQGEAKTSPSPMAADSPLPLSDPPLPSASPTPAPHDKAANSGMSSPPTPAPSAPERSPSPMANLPPLPAETSDEDEHQTDPKSRENGQEGSSKPQAGISSPSTSSVLPDPDPETGAESEDALDLLPPPTSPGRPSPAKPAKPSTKVTEMVGGKDSPPPPETPETDMDLDVPSTEKEKVQEKAVTPPPKTIKMPVYSPRSARRPHFTTAPESSTKQRAAKTTKSLRTPTKIPPSPQKGTQTSIEELFANTAQKSPKRAEKEKRASASPERIRKASISEFIDLTLSDDEEEEVDKQMVERDYRSGYQALEDILFGESTGIPDQESAEAEKGEATEAAQASEAPKQYPPKLNLQASQETVKAEPQTQASKPPQADAQSPASSVSPTIPVDTSGIVRQFRELRKRREEYAALAAAKKAEESSTSQATTPATSAAVSTASSLSERLAKATDGLHIGASSQASGSGLQKALQLHSKAPPDDDDSSELEYADWPDGENPYASAKAKRKQMEDVVEDSDTDALNISQNDNGTPAAETGSDSEEDESEPAEKRQYSFRTRRPPLYPPLPRSSSASSDVASLGRDPLDGFASEDSPLHSVSPNPDAGSIRMLGGVQVHNWASYRTESTVVTSGSAGSYWTPVYYLARDLPHTLQDHINAMSEETRQLGGMRFVFESAIMEATALDEPEAPPITIENKVDAEPTPPWEFHYSNRMWYGEGVPPPRVDSGDGCDCIGRCDPRSGKCKCANKFAKWVKDHDYGDMGVGGDFLYDGRGKLRNPHSAFPIFECGDRCRCDDECRNRVVQHGRKVALKIAKTKNKGWGVFAGPKRIPKGTFVGIYSGELILDSDGEKRGKIYNAFGRTYLLDLDFWYLHQPVGNDDESEDELGNFYTIDAYHAGNFTRFLNHSCDPNLVLHPCYFNDSDETKPLLCLFAQKDIDSGEEMCFSYSRVDDEDEDTSADPAATIHQSPSKTKAKSDAIYEKCMCGAKNCRGIMFA